MHIIKFSASWCAPCKALGIELERVSPDLLSKFNIQNVDVDKDMELAMQYGVRSVPMMIVKSDDGVILGTIRGFQTANKLTEFLSKY